MYKVSIIVPVYNCEKYLSTCIDSLLEQTLRDIEIILINDGSTDSSPKILDEYGEKYTTHLPYLRIIHQENMGRMEARRKGIDIAQSEYLGFVDSDDWIASTMYEELYTSAMQEKLDIVSGGFINVDEMGNETSRSIFPNDYNEIREERIFSDSPPSLCNSIFKKTLFNNIHITYLNVSRGEDLALLPCLYYFANNVKMLPSACYYYRNIDINQGQKSENKNSSNILSQMPISLQKDLEGMKELFIVAQHLAKFFIDKNTKAIDLLPLTTKFPDIFNRYNFKFTDAFLCKNNLWDWYFFTLIEFIHKYPTYYLALKDNCKSENKIVLQCFEKIFSQYLPQHLTTIESHTSSGILPQKILVQNIQSYRMLQRKYLQKELLARIIRKVFRILKLK